MKRAGLFAFVLVSGTFASFSALSMQPDAASRGKALFDYHCATCHGRGIGNPGEAMKPGTSALTFKYKGRIPGLLEERTDLTPELVAYFVRNGATVMAPYRRTEIRDEELAAIGAYLSRHKTSTRKGSR